MKKSAICFFTLLFFVLGTAVTFAAPQSDSRASSIGIMDMNRIMAESPKVKALQAQLNDLGKTLSDQLAAEKLQLTPEEYEKKRQIFYQEFLQREKELENQIDESLGKAISQVVKEKGLSVVLYKNGVAYGGIDITSDVLSRMQ